MVLILVINIWLYREDKAMSKPAVPRYYGRKKDDKSSSELSLDSDSSDSAEEPKNKLVNLLF